MAVAARRPGVRFEAPPPPSPGVLPRMDVAGFAGYATAGPFDVPVPVESPDELAALFGPDPVLGVTPDGGEARGLLGPAVRAFFANGGRRCWVVRAGAGGETSTAPIPGLAILTADGLAPALPPVRSPGSWADGLRAGGALLATPLRLLGIGGGPARLLLAARAGDGVVVSDVLRVGLAGGDALVLVTAVAPGAGGAAVTYETLVWLPHLALPAAPAPAAVGERSATVVGADDDERGVALRLRLPAVSPAAPDPRVGDMLRVRVAGADVLAWVDRVEQGADGASDVRAAGPWVARGADAPPVADGASVERLSLELWARPRDGAAVRLSDLGFAPGHPAHAGLLPADHRLYGIEDDPTPAVWDRAAGPRFPLSGLGRDALLLPLGLPSLPRELVTVRSSGAAARVRDGASAFTLDAFVDRDLANVRLDGLEASADALRYGDPGGRRLHGVHALLAVEEVTMVAAPDAVHGGWDAREPVAVVPSSLVEGVPRPDAAGFADCAVRVLATPVVSPPVWVSPGVASLSWSATDADAATYVLEASGDPVAFAGRRTLHEGPARSFEQHGAEGVLYVRVQARAGALRSDWSVPVPVDARPAGDVVVQAPPAPDPTVLAVHRAMLRACAARGDLVALLCVHPWADAEGARAHAAALTGMPRPDAVPVASGVVPPLDDAEARALSHGALFHQWPVVAAGGGGTAVPPDGVAAGQLARRAARRGAWVAAANLPVAGAVAIEGLEIGADAHGALETAGVNVLAREPLGYVWRSQETLSLDPDLRALNVRRLLALLRRAALQHGADHVFEPDSDTFRRSVEADFDALLAGLHRRGAFRGRLAPDAYRVVVHPRRGGAGEGRFEVDLLVAPSRPLTFLTVRLLHDDRRGLAAAGS